MSNNTSQSLALMIDDLAHREQEPGGAVRLSKNGTLLQRVTKEPGWNGAVSIIIKVKGTRIGQGRVRGNIMQK